MPSGTDLDGQVRASGVDHVVLEFPDINGVSRSKQVTVEHFLEHWEDGWSIPIAILACTPRTVPAAGSGYAEEINYADGRLHPDPATFKTVPWLADTGRVLCDFSFRGEVLAGAPRELLRRVIRSVPAAYDVGIGSELEFYLLDVTEEGYMPATPHEHESVSWITEQVAPYYRQLAEWAGEYGVPVESLQHEYGPGQLEVLFDYGTPLVAGDRAFDFKRLVKATARANGRRATFMSKPFPEQSGSGYHLHVSLRQNGENAFDDGDGHLSETGRQFVGGLLEHADSLVALQAPTLNAFKRFERGSFVPSTVSWGYDNRLAGVRIPIGEPRVELRLGGADANPYVAIAATLAAGLHGIETGLDPGEPVNDRDPADERPDLERTPELALRALEDDDAMVAALGKEFIKAYVAVKRQDLAEFRDAVTDWERESYVEML